MKGDECTNAVEMAIDIGFRHIDTAFFYENERDVGKAIRSKIEDGTVKRQDLFVVTKVIWYDRVISSIQYNKNYFHFFI